jgi:hypothetical protein
MWGGLARDIMMAMSFSGPLTPRGLLRHLECTGAEIPQWLREEPEMLSPDHAISKGTRCVLIYRAMLWDGRAAHLTPSGHAPDCEFHCEQYPWECTCGATPRAAPAIEARRAATTEIGAVEDESAVPNDSEADAQPTAPITEQESHDG